MSTLQNNLSISFTPECAANPGNLFTHSWGFGHFILQIHSELSATILVCFIYSHFCFSPLTGWRQLLHLLLLDLLIHLGGFVEQTLQVAVGTLEGGLWLDTSTHETWVKNLTPLARGSTIRSHWGTHKPPLTSAGSSRSPPRCRTYSQPVCPVDWKAFLERSTATNLLTTALNNDTEELIEVFCRILRKKKMLVLTKVIWLDWGKKANSME